MTKSIRDIGTIYRGKEICVQIAGIKNNSENPVEDVYVDITVPPGLTFQSANLNTVGSFDLATNRWNLGTLLGYQEVLGEFCYIVDDECLETFEFVFEIDSLQKCTGCLGQKQHCEILNGYSCCYLTKCGRTKPFVTKTASYIIDETEDYTIQADINCSLIELPDPTSIKGRIFVITELKTSAFTQVYVKGGLLTISGSTTYTFSAQYETIVVQSDGSNWIIISKS